MDRFKLEELITSARQIGEDLQVVMQGQFDRKKGLTEDQIMNMIIGMQELHECRCDMLWECYEQMVKEGKIT
tara:strand:+ start:392 stop:607 length:216 start_codon:yes stop_codon:yes gene_type:complete